MGEHLTVPAQARLDPVPALVRWAFYLFLFSLPFEYPGRSIPIETTTLTGALFVGIAALWPGRCFRLPPAALWLFLGYLYVYWVAIAMGGGFFAADALKSSLTMLLMILVIWAASGILQDQRVAERGLLVFGSACALLAAMTLLGVLTKAGLDPDTDTIRVTVLGQNPNRAARILMGGALVLLGLAYGRARAWIRPPLIVWPFIGAIAIAMIQGGSRGGLLALAIGLIMFVLAGTSLRTTIRNAAVAVLAVGVVAAFAARSPLIQRRFAMAGEGNFAKREQIFPSAFGMFLDRPLIGWGAENEYELARRLPQRYRTSRDTHNLVLHVLTTTGLVGALPFFAGLLFAVRAAWLGRRGPLGALPLALLIALLAGNLSGNYIALKVQWVAIALAFASYALARAAAPAGVTLPARMTRHRVPAIRSRGTVGRPA